MAQRKIKKIVRKDADFLKMRETTQSGYLREAFEPKLFKRYVNNTIAAIEKFKDGFDSIAFRGLSGALVAPAVALALGKNLIMVRKESDGNTHADDLVEGKRAKQKYIIIDDFKCSGRTIRTIIRDISKHLNEENECVAVVFWLKDEPMIYFGGGADLDRLVKEAMKNDD